MFTGIIEATGTIADIKEQGTNRIFWINSLISNELRVDQSICHNGVCLTVEEVTGNAHRVTAIEETLAKTTVGNWKTGDLVNLERCLVMNGRLDGHIVQGHVDGVGTCIYRKDLNGSWEFGFEFAEKFGPLVIEKGSVTLNGISLTVFNVGKNSFSVGIIPYTFEHTNLNKLSVDGLVNLEFDILGKYALRHFQIKNWQ